MKNALLVNALVALALTTMSGGTAYSTATANEPFRGVNLYFTGYDATQPALIDKLLGDLSDMHVNTIMLTFPIYIDSINGNEIEAVNNGSMLHPYGDTPTSDEMQALVVPARTRGFDVWLRPLLDETRLHEESRGSAWRGMLAPSDPGAFFASYTMLVSSVLEGASGASWLVIGTEFNSLQAPEYDAYWTNLIEAVRAHSHSSRLRLSYAVNWSTGDDPAAPPWLGLLDGMSVDAYYPTGPLSPDASSDEISANLQQWLPNLQAYRDAFPDLPLYISEIGVASQTTIPSVLQQPWHAETAGVPPNPEVQARYAAGACSFYTGAIADDGSPMIEGLFWWRTSVVPLAHPLDDLSHEFRGKPASEAIAACFVAWQP